MKLSKHCNDNAGDRKIGAYWERQFCLMAGRERDVVLTPHQLITTTNKAAIAASCKDGAWDKNPYLLPDITIWSAPGEHHEIKHKNPTPHGTYGLEEYRLVALLAFAQETQQHVLYTIHDWGLAGGRDVRVNRIEHWRTVDVQDLWEIWTFRGLGDSYVNGVRRKVWICYWPVELWMPLEAWWAYVHPKQ